MGNCCSYLRHVFESHRGVKFTKLETTTIGFSALDAFPKAQAEAGRRMSDFEDLREAEIARIRWLRRKIRICRDKISAFAVYVAKMPLLGFETV